MEGPYYQRGHSQGLSWWLRAYRMGPLQTNQMSQQTIFWGHEGGMCMYGRRSSPSAW